MDDSLGLEKHFKPSTVVFKILPNNVVTLVWQRPNVNESYIQFSTKTIFSHNKYASHFGNAYSCEDCSKKIFNQVSKFVQHNCSSQKNHLHFLKGCYRANRKIVDLLKSQARISVGHERVIYPYRIIRTWNHLWIISLYREVWKSWNIQPNTR